MIQDIRKGYTNIVNVFIYDINMNGGYLKLMDIEVVKYNKRIYKYYDSGK